METSTHILIFNCGSSSLSYKVYDCDSGDGKLTSLASGKAHHVGVVSQESAYLEHQILGEAVTEVKSLPDHRSAAEAVLQTLASHGLAIQTIGHRFVHGGARFTASTLINAQNLAELRQCSSLAPIHNPNSLSVIDLCSQLMPHAIQFACFDTAFHAGLPEVAYRYALPIELADRYGLRKFGFHGISYQYVTAQAALMLGKAVGEARLVACHLGTGGSSVTAIRGGQSLDTSMGYSPLAGLIMSTRSGDLDPAIPLDLIEQYGFSASELNDLFNHRSGLLGISGLSSDLFELIELGAQGNQRAQLAVDMYVHRLKSFIGSSLAALGGADALVFTDDIGVHAWQIRAQAGAGLEFCGMKIDEQANRRAVDGRPACVSAKSSPIQVLVIPTDEERVIAQEGVRLLKSG
jgi:acetate kinase